MKLLVIIAFLFTPLSLFSQIKGEITFGLDFAFNKTIRYDRYVYSTPTSVEDTTSDIYKSELPNVSLAIIYPIDNIDLGIKFTYVKATQTNANEYGNTISINLWPVSLYGQYNFKGVNFIPFLNTNIGFGFSELGGIGTTYGLGVGVRIKNWIIVGAGYDHLEAKNIGVHSGIEWHTYDYLYRFNSVKLFAGVRF
jgi:hypothetical protein